MSWSLMKEDHGSVAPLKLGPVLLALIIKSPLERLTKDSPWLSVATLFFDVLARFTSQTAS